MCSAAHPLFPLDVLDLKRSYGILERIFLAVTEIK